MKIWLDVIFTWESHLSSQSKRPAMQVSPLMQPIHSPGNPSARLPHIPLKYFLCRDKYFIKKHIFMLQQWNFTNSIKELITITMIVPLSQGPPTLQPRLSLQSYLRQSLSQISSSSRHLLFCLPRSLGILNGIHSVDILAHRSFDMQSWHS